jgi:hypothetical protein
MKGYIVSKKYYKELANMKVDKMLKTIMATRSILREDAAVLI